MATRLAYGDESLFLSPQEQATVPSVSPAPAESGRAVNSSSAQPPHRLIAIFRRPDLGSWTVWVDGCRIDSHRPVSVRGWRVVDVGDDHVVFVSMDGKTHTVSLDPGYPAAAVPTESDETTP